jgi:7-carboxy-7-deazaguanine synthase (Cx14CxxC type)
MSYAVKEIYYTLQGEGFHAGRPAVFLRFAGCNLWTGREQHRSKAACQFCDTDFVGTDGPNGGRYESADDLADVVTNLFPADGLPFVVCTGGEPLLQLDDDLLLALHDRGCEVAVETNGTVALPDTAPDWVTVSPKAGTTLKVTRGDELKLVFPQPDAPPEKYERLDFNHFFLQPMDGPNLAENTRLAVDYCLKHPEWRLSLQTHKVIGIP